MALGKRYEIYLPLKYNPDEQQNRHPIEKAKFDQTYEELWREFLGVTVTAESENQALRGFWFDEFDEPYTDEVTTAIVYATNINNADAFFRQAINSYKE